MFSKMRLKINSYKNIIIIICLFLISLISWYFYDSFMNVKTISSDTIAQESNTLTGNVVDLGKNENDYFKSWDFSWAIDYYEKKIKEDNSYKNKIFLVNSYLSYGNYFYKEAESSKKALDILNTMEEKYDVLYFKWYANEIIKNYTWALTYYNKWLKIKELSKKEKSLLLNQIWHLYDLKWDIETAYKNYKLAYTIYKKNYIVSVNIGRYLARKWKYEDSKIYFEYWLNIESKPIKSEVYYSLSTIELELNWLKPDINKSIEYANKSIEEYPSYAMWYVALARWYYMLNDKKYYKDIKDNLVKSMVLNNKWFESYSYSGLLEFDKWNYDATVMLMKYSIYMIKNDILLMDNERIITSIQQEAKVTVLWLINTLKKEWKIKNKNLFEKFEKLPFWKSFIKFQLKRTNYWIFSDFEWIEEYVKSYK